ncbi:hypothetical protein Tco_0772350 [Tanacetum coccineum]|uniref:Uncharacterized protein n=1 Tax=Tanacetum coccineum TaxID=301880 RepID=A0ABQ4ZHN9_9ASTR
MGRPEKKGGSRTHKLKRLYRVARSRRVVSSKEESLGDQEDASKQGRIDDIDADKDIYLVNVHIDEDMFGVNNLEGDEIVVEREVVDKDVNLSVDEVTLAQALAALKSAKVKEKGDVIKEPSVAVSATSTKNKNPLLRNVSSQQPTQVKDKGKGKMVKEEPVKKMGKKLIKVEEANIALNDIQAKVDVDYQLAQRLQAQEQEEFSDAEKATLPPTKAQQRSFMCTYLKKLEGWKPKDLKNKSFANIQDLFDKAIKRVNTFIELVKESSRKAEAETAQESNSKRAGEALEQESSKKQKVDDDKETEELKKCMEINSDDEDDVTIEATPLSTKSPTIAMFEHHLEDSVWKNQQGLVKVLNWKLYDSYGVHCVTMQNILYYLLVEKMYPLIKHTLYQMFNDVKLQVDYECEWHLSS